MSAKTPDYILQSIYNSAHLNDPDLGPTMTAKEWQTLVKDMGSWFTWQGTAVTMRARSIGGGMYQIVGKLKYPPKKETP